ncbi:hypothetical protein EJ02DRAFT_59193 [Clathrospora elynae]|uniref:Uncharacterized protein n=1 Tax=Clathrospora elynae TaxID=706981 RepID=A0A6A5SWX4_9PLEO|nr:hypothetical protein EJ02DRAFT_59193 [Clathrospora elynae]
MNAPPCVSRLSTLKMLWDSSSNGIMTFRRKASGIMSAVEEGYGILLGRDGKVNGEIRLGRGCRRGSLCCGMWTYRCAGRGCGLVGVGYTFWGLLVLFGD